MATHSSILVWKIPWTEDPGRLQSMGSQRVGHDWATSLSLSYSKTENFIIIFFFERNWTDFSLHFHLWNSLICKCIKYLFTYKFGLICYNIGNIYCIMFFCLTYLFPWDMEGRCGRRVECWEKLQKLNMRSKQQQQQKIKKVSKVMLKLVKTIEI